MDFITTGGFLAFHIRISRKLIKIIVDFLGGFFFPY